MQSRTRSQAIWGRGDVLRRTQFRSRACPPATCACAPVLSRAWASQERRTQARQALLKRRCAAVRGSAFHSPALH